MKNTTKIISLIPLLSMLLVCTTCEKEEDYNAVTYYDAVGIGYVFIYDSIGSTMHSAQGAEIRVCTYLEGSDGGLFSTFTAYETYTTNANGKYQIRFIKRTHRRDAREYYITLNHIGSRPYQIWNNGAQFYSKEVINAPNNIVIIDTIKIAYH